MGTALITGASSGLGEEYAWQLASAGHSLVLVARRKDRLDTLAASLRGATGVEVEVLAADLTQAEGVATVARRLDVGSDPFAATECAPVGLLINNAGHGFQHPFVDNDLEQEESGLDLMVRAVLVLSHHAARSMRARGRGAILNVSSIASETGAGTYSAHKAWVKAFTEGLALELAGSGVSATCVMPGPTRTEFFENSGVQFHSLPAWAWSSSEQVVEESLRAVRRGQVLVTPHPASKAALALMRLAPRWVTRAVVRHVPHT